MVSPVVSFPQVSPPKPCAHLSLTPYVPHAPPISFFSILSPAQYWVRGKENLAPHYVIVKVAIQFEYIIRPGFHRSVNELFHLYNTPFRRFCYNSIWKTSTENCFRFSDIVNEVNLLSGTSAAVWKVHMHQLGIFMFNNLLNGAVQNLQKTKPNFVKFLQF